MSRAVVPEPIAIIGMACIYPGAADLAHYWSNIVQGVDAISEVPENRWAGLFYDPASTQIDRFYCRRGGFIDAYADFDPLKYGIMPKAAAAAEPDQLLALRVGMEALQDAGYERREFPRARTGVIIGRGNYLNAGTLRLEQHVRLIEQTLQTLRDLLPAVTTEQLQQVREQIQQRLDYYGPDVALGMIPNLVASRLANRLDLQGPAYTVDAACASSLLAIEQATGLLRSRQTDMMLAGGVHLTHDLTFWATFCQLGALSRSQMIRPFSQMADGILAGEGVGMLVLKRQADAERDNDRIYALIDGVASSSDGRSGSLLAPAIEGQLLALQRAWQQTRLKPEALGLLEAHGTGTPAGDQAELRTLAAFFGDAAALAPAVRPVLGSVKSMIGHTMPAAGVAGVIKAALAIHHGVLPPSLHCEAPHPLLERTRFRLLGRQEDWLTDDGQRVAGVNAFGFGGINAHVILSQPIKRTNARRSTRAAAAQLSAPSRSAALPKTLLLAAASQAELLTLLQSGNWTTASGQTGRGSWRLAIVEPDEKRLELALKLVGKGQRWHGRNQIYFSPDGLLQQGGKLAFVFPGVDSSFAPQAADVAAYFNVPLSAYCAPADPAQALFRVVLGVNKFNRLMYETLQRLGIHADGLAGHSIGEFSAMAAGGMLTQERVDAVMGVLENDPSTLQVPDVVFLAAACNVAQARQAIAGLPEICISHDNCPHQVILCGRAASTQIAAQRLLTANVLSQPLPFVSGFHSPMFAGHMQQYRDFYDQTDLFEPQIPVWSATSAARFPADMAAKKHLALEHLLQPVRFRELIQHMYADGFRAFIQVGTGSLPGFIEDTLKHQSHLTLAANLAKRTGMAQLCHLVAALWVEGGSPDLSLLGYEATPRAAAISASSLKLQLGVPLVKLDPQQAPVLAMGLMPPSEEPALTNDPLELAYRQTLQSIQQASQEIRELWQRRRLTPPAGALAGRTDGAAAAPAAIPQTQAATPLQQAGAIASTSGSFAPFAVPLPFSQRIRQHLDIRTTIPYVADHELYPQRPGWPVAADAHPVVPLTMEVMLLREAIEAALPGHVVVRFIEVHAYNWLVVERPIDIEIRLEMKQYPELDVAIEGYMKAKAQVDRHYPALVSRLDGQRSGVFERRSTQRNSTFENQRPTAVDAQTLYQEGWMFHGPSYQGIRQLGPIADNGICGRLMVTAGKGALLDNMGQLAGYWVMEQESDSLAMPISVDRISFYGPDPQLGNEFDCQVWVRHLDAVSCITDQRLLDEHGQVLIAMDGWQTRRYQMDREFFLQTKQVQQRLVSETLGHGIVLFQDRFETAIVRDYLARRFLNQEEMLDYEKNPPRRRRQWLNGRVAAKDAARNYLWHKHGRFELYPKELRISNNAQGQPQIATHVTTSYAESLHLSIAHKDLLALAIVSEQPVGIDIERIASQSEEFINLAMSLDEARLLPQDDRDEWVTRFWVAKEALAKRQGTGLEGKPKRFCVREIDGQKLRVNEQWVITQRRGDYILGWTI